MTKNILAKSFDKQKYEDIPEFALLIFHLIQCFNTSKKIWKLRGKDILKSCALPYRKYYKRISKILHVASFFHDIGKCNDHFLELIWCFIDDKKGITQSVRHEFVSLFIVRQPFIMNEIKKYLDEDIDYLIVCWAISSHHIKFQNCVPSEIREGANILKKMKILFSSPDFKKIIDYSNKLFNINIKVPSNDIEIDFIDDMFFDDLNKYKHSGNKTQKNIDKELKIMTVICRSLICQSDATSSALCEKDFDPAKWVTSAISMSPSTEDIDKLIKAKIGDSPYTKFQINVSNAHRNRILIKGECGEGKTIAYLLRILKKYPNRKVLKLMPTTATVVNMFNSYFFDRKNKKSYAGSDIFESRYDSDIRRIIENYRYEDYTGNYDADDICKINSLRMSTTPFAVSTVDKCIGLIQNYRSSVYSFSEIISSIIIADEIHSYDEKLFANFLRFLDTFPNIPVIMSTATIQPEREKALKKYIKGLQIVEGDKNRRYNKKYTYYDENEIDTYQNVEETYCNGEKVLIARNTIFRAMNDYLTIKEEHPDWNVFILHSRFKNEDKYSIQMDINNYFDNNNPVVVIGTQIIEISFDFSANLLVTDICPISSLIQRLGRLARFLGDRGILTINKDIEIDSGWSPYYVSYDDPIERRNIKQEAIDFENRLKHLKKYSFWDFCQLWKKVHIPTNKSIDIKSELVDNFNVGNMDSLRKTGMTISVILKSDLCKAERANKKGELYYDNATLIDHSIPMDINDQIKPYIKKENRVNGHYIVDDKHIVYNKNIGATWVYNKKHMEIFNETINI